ncbi:hypothetical protein V8Z74_05345 [Comamonas sp. w2-DMI]|uniref:hypothetical protein n=1 Tax=Comamonas sp. w2-DMI TaxID=3126391 RepID=UPI0032E436BC
MTTELLRRIARSRLPLTLSSREEVEAVRQLRKQGLVLALVPAPSDPVNLSGTATAAQVLAITPEGLDRLASAPASQPHRMALPPGWIPWLRTEGSGYRHQAGARA